jgi:hypothetical protein
MLRWELPSRALIWFEGYVESLDRKIVMIIWAGKVKFFTWPI